MEDFKLVTEFSEYNTAVERTNAPENILIAGSQNVLIDRQRKIRTRNGYTRLGASNTALKPVRSNLSWDTSTGTKLALRSYDDELECYFDTVDNTEINAWKRVSDSRSTTEILRFANWFDATENLDVTLFVEGTDQVFEWNGAAAIWSANSALQIAEAGDGSGQLSNWAITGTVTSSNTNDFVLYYQLTDSGGTRTVQVYKDSAGSNLVMSGSQSGDGTVTLTEQNSSGLSGSVDVAYSTDDTTISANTLTLTWNVTKQGTDTWAQNRFYATGNKTFINVRTGQEYTYTGGEATTTLTGVKPTTALDFTTDDLLIQKIVTHDNEPADGRNNHTIAVHENQVFLGSNDDEEVYVSHSDDVTDYSFSSPRAPGEGALLTLTDPVRGFGPLGQSLIIFCGQSQLFRTVYNEFEVNSALAETLAALPVKIGVDQGAFNQECIVPIGNAVAYLSNEPAMRMLETTDIIEQPQLTTLSNPIKPDFDNEDFTNAHGYWFKNALYLSAPANSRLYINEWVQDADGQLRRFWQPPQLLPVRAMMGYQGKFYGHSNSVPETYELFAEDTFSDISSDDDKLPINCIAIFSYRNFGTRGRLKSFDEYYVEGEISPNTNDLTLTINYDFGGLKQTLQEIINGSDNDILEETLENVSLGQNPLAQQPLGGSLNVPGGTAKFRTILEQAREDFHEMNVKFNTNEVDRFWSLLAHGPNATLSTRRANIIRK